MTRTTSIGGPLGRLRRDKRGNTLAIAAASLVPISAMVGSGLDASRTYLVKARLQSACDAGALAARKVMDGSGTINTNARTTGTTFFKNNFPAGTYGTSNGSFALSLDSAQQVIGTATVRVPMTLMKMFNYQHIDLSATCSARLDITNTDVMFVLDTTGSMLCKANGSECNGGPESKIVGLRAAVAGFTSALSGAAPPTARIRYGFVPYSSTVNVGALLQPSWVNSTWSYQSRVANFNTGLITASSRQNGESTASTESYANLTDGECSAWGSDYGSPPYLISAGGGPARGRSYVRADWGADGTTGDRRTCRRNVVEQNYFDPVIQYRFTDWTYGPTSFDAGAFKAGSTVAVATDTPRRNFYVNEQRSYNVAELAVLPEYTTRGGFTENSRWDGCIEERTTVADAVGSSYEISPSAYDLDIDRPAMSSDTNWRAAWPQAMWSNSFFGFTARPWDYRNLGYYACPSAARKLGVMTQGEVQTYVGGLVAFGGTYHDTGMIWGSRLISTTGIFGAENQTAPNGQEISRSIVFMTDGDMAPNQYIANLYGYEQGDKRISGAGAGNFNDLRDRHNKRYVAMCKAIRAKNISLYVVAFGQALNSEMEACATPGQAFYAANPAALQSRFIEIATRIAKLRLSQ